MQYSKKDYEILGRQVAAGHYVTRSVAVLAVILALLAGLCLGRYIFPAPEFFASGGEAKRPLGQNSTIQPSTSPGGRLFQSILQHEEEVRDNPDSAETWVHLGDLYFDAGEPAKAVNAYNRSLELVPDNVNVLVDCGTMYRALEQYDKALEYYDKALALESKHEHALFNSGIVLYYDLKRKDEAIARWQALVKLNPNAAAPSGALVSDIIKELQ